MWKRSSWRAPGVATRPGSPFSDEGETDIQQRLATLEALEAVCVEGMRAAAEIVAAADERDALADARDLSAEQHEHGLDLAHFLAAEDDDYGYDWPERRAAALDREHARQDRIAARGDLTALVRMFAQTAEPAELGASWQGPVSVALDGA